MPAFVLRQQSWLAATETAWSTKLKIFITWPFAEKICQPLARSLKMFWSQSLLGLNEQYCLFCFPLKESIPFLLLATRDPLVGNTPKNLQKIQVYAKTYCKMRFWFQKLLKMLDSHSLVLMILCCLSCCGRQEEPCIPNHAEMYTHATLSWE